MICHACAAPMAMDRYGHPVHAGRCPGYPPAASRPAGERRRRCTICGTVHRRHCADSRANRWPIGPLLEEAWRHAGERTYASAAERIGIHDTQLHRTGGTLTDEQADRWAIALGSHPGAIWPGWFDGVADPLLDALLAGGWRRAWLAGEAPTPARRVAA